MKDLKEIVDEQVIQKPQSDLKYRLLGIAAVLILLYLAYNIAFLDFKRIPFVNKILGDILHIFTLVTMWISDFLRQIWYRFAG